MSNNLESSNLQSQVAYLSGLIERHKSKQNNGQTYSKSQYYSGNFKFTRSNKYRIGNNLMKVNNQISNQLSMERRPNINLNRTLSKKIVNPTFCETEISSNKYKVNRLNNIDHKNSAKNKTNNNDRSQFKVLTKHSSQKTVSALNEKKLVICNKQSSKSTSKSTNNYHWQAKSSISTSCDIGNAKFQQLSNVKTKSTYKLINNSSSKVRTNSNTVNSQQNKVQSPRINQTNLRKLKRLKNANSFTRSSRHSTSNNINRIIGKPKLKRSVTSKLVRINGVMYETSAAKLQKSQKKASNNRRVIPISSSKPNKSRKLINVDGLKFYIDQSSKKLVRVCHISPSSCKSTSIGFSSRLSKMKQRNVYLLSNLNSKRIFRVQMKHSWKNLATSHISSCISPATSFVNQAVNRSLNNVRNKTSVKKKIGATAGGYCMFYNRFGKCNKDEKCVFLHDPDKIAVCTRFLRGTCKVTDCPFSHKVSQDKMPVCSFFLKGKCILENCPYRHVNVNPNASICEDFISGFCPKHSQCKKLHSLTCVTFLKTGNCSKGSSCRFKHIHLKKKKISSSVYTKNLKESQEETNFDRNCRGPMFVSLKSSPSVKKISVRSEESSNADPGNKNATTGSGLQIQPSFQKLQCSEETGK